MATTCHIHPFIKNKEGKYVRSILWNDILKEETLLPTRVDQKKLYQGVHSDYFMGWFGDWLNDPNAKISDIKYRGDLKGKSI